MGAVINGVLANTGIVPKKKGPPVDKEAVMAKNTGDGFRRGAVTGRTQFERPDGHWQKRNERTGEFMPVKQTDGPFKGIAKEPDGRDTENS